MSNAEDSKYKDTLNLPQTDFPMRGNLPQSEPITLAQWDKADLYARILKKNAGRPLFVMPDGPPYANGNIHLGHVLNKVLKDIVIKYKNMSGYSAAFIPGWDCHGLPIELKVTQKLGKEKRDLDSAAIRDLCRKEALQWVETQRGQFQRLGILADWQNPYLTLQPDYEAEEVRVLARIHRNGILYRGEKPVYWCPALQTALAAAEVEYQEHKSPSIYVKFYLTDSDRAKIGVHKPTAFLIWTTTPWTLPANYGIALGPNFTYGLFETSTGENLIVARDLKEAVEKACGLELRETRTFKGSELEGLKARHPFMDRDSLVVLGDHVTLDAGTGAVHTAPGHGMEDYVVGLKYGLPVKSPVDPAGRFTAEVAKYQGMKIWDANKAIIEDLKGSGHLMGHTEITHSYAYNPRSKTPLIFRATPQWFVRMDDDAFGLRKLALNACESQIEFVPRWGHQRLTAMVSNTPDWCLSRQRYWGVPIPVFYCEKCETALVDADIMDRVADLMERTQKGIDAYHEAPVRDLVGDAKCASCGHDGFKKGQDILDVWFDSGVCHSAVQKRREGMTFPADIYLEGSDQHRGWFQTSLMSSLAAYRQPPYKALITHGFVNDEQGYKMSKSKGNYVDPAELIKKNGAEILRLWVAYEDYGQDVNAGAEIFQRITETYRRIRNTLRFLLGNLGDFNPETDLVAVADMTSLDRWALDRLNAVIEKCTEAYEGYDFYKVYHALNNFFTVDLSATYLDILKDRLYTWKPNGRPRRSSQTVLYHVLESVVGLMAPILSFLAEETHRYIPGRRAQSVFLTEFPKVREAWKAPEALMQKFTVLFEVRSETAKALEERRREKLIGSSLDAKVVLTAGPDRFTVFKEFEKDLRELLIVSQVELRSGTAFSVEVQKADGAKCERCWNYSPDIGKDPRWPEVCPKCVEALA